MEMALHTHIKALAGPILADTLLVIAVAACWIFLSDQPIVCWIATGIAVIGVVIFFVVPLAKWLSSSYVVTNKRVVTRSGIVTRRGRDIPLYRINDVATEQGPIDRLLGCGTLEISDASDGPGMVWHDVPNVDHVQVRLHELLFAHDDGSDDGEFPPTEPPRVGGTPA